jgi:uncharacterized protein YceK
MNIGDKLSAIFFGVNYPKSKVIDSLLIPHSTIKINKESKSKVIDSLLIPHSTIKITTSDSLQLEAC